nr:reverse transcriptase domain-containing protein [Tanacetum cinerariifolium]
TAYPGPTIPTTSSSPVVERETEATKDTMNPTNNESTEDVQPPVVPTESPILTSEPIVSPIIEPIASPVSAPRPNQRPLIPYPSRLQDQKVRNKANDQCENFFQIFKDLNFNISFADALILMPKFGPSIKSLLTNKDKICELAITPLSEHCSAVLLKKLPEKLGDRGNFLIPCDFPRMAECLTLADLGASINLMPLSVWNKLSLPNLSPTCMTLELTDRSISRSIGVAEDVFIKVEAFLNDDISLPPLNQGNYLPEFRNELKIYEAKFDKSSIDEPTEVELKDLTPHLEYAFLEGDEKLPVIITKDLRWFYSCRIAENELIPTRLVTGWRVCIDYRKLNEATRKDHFPLPFMDQILERLAGNQYYCFLDGFSGYFLIPIDPKDQGKPHSPAHTERLLTAACLLGYAMHLARFRGHAGFYRRFIKDFSKIARSITCLLEKDTPFIFSKKRVEAFQTLKRKLTETPILIAPDWDMPFELMCDASNFAIGTVLGQRQEKHFRPIHHASKTMTEVESNYTTAEKEMLAVVYAFEKFRSYLIMNKSIVYTDHSAHKYLFAKKGSKARLLRWVLLLQEFTFKVIDRKEAENLAAEHLSRLENPNQNVLDPKELTNHFLSRHSIWFLLVVTQVPHGLLTLQTIMRGISLSRACRPNRKVNSSRM